MRFSSLAVTGALGLGLMACEKPMDAQEAAATSDNALSATAQCVRQATDAELIAELQARLGASGPSTPSEASICTFGCDVNTNLLISVIGPSGTEKKTSLFTGSANTCRSYSDKLNQTRHEITRVSLAAVCDSNTNLHRYSITPQGELAELEVRFIGSASSCTQQAEAINR